MTNWAEFDAASLSLEAATSQGERRDALERQLRAVVRQRGITPGDVEKLPLALWDPATIRRAMAEGKKAARPTMAWELGAWALGLYGSDRDSAIDASITAFEQLAAQPAGQTEEPFVALAPALDVAQAKRALVCAQKMVAAGWGRSSLAVVTARLDVLGVQGAALGDAELEATRAATLEMWRAPQLTFGGWSTWLKGVADTELDLPSLVMAVSTRVGALGLPGAADVARNVFSRVVS